MDCKETEKDLHQEKCEEKAQQLDETTTQEELETIEVDAVSDLEMKITELEDKNLRLLAEFNNFKKRSSEEYTQAKYFGQAEVFKKLIDTLDSFERALTTTPDGEAKVGMQLIYDKLISDMLNCGLEEIDATGKLDPNYHQALMVDNIEDLEDDQIIEVLQKGYKVNDILIRPSMVKVNKK